MNIYARRGDKVIFRHPTSGYQYDQERAKQYLKLNKVYTVGSTYVVGWHTDVYLQEIQGVAFNSVHFEDNKPLKNRKKAKKINRQLRRR